MKCSTVILFLLIAVSCFAQGNNNSLDYDGGDYLRSDSAAYRSGDNTGTISLWVKYSSLVSASRIFAIGINTGNDPQLTLGILDVAGSMYIWIFRNVSGTVGTRGSTPILVDTWYHLVVTSNGSLWALFVNGNDETETNTHGSNDGTWFNDLGGTHNRVALGALVKDNVSGFVTGVIDEVAVFSDILSPAEIIQIYNYGVPYDITGFDHLVDYWRFEEGSGTTTDNEATDNPFTFGDGATGTTYPSWGTDIINADFYVSDQGSDSNTGTGLINSWLTVDYAVSTALSPSDNIYLFTGDLFREQVTMDASGTDGLPITVSAVDSAAVPRYGSDITGDQPKISGADLMTTFDLADSAISGTEEIEENWTDGDSVGWTFSGGAEVANQRLEIAVASGSDYIQQAITSGTEYWVRYKIYLVAGYTWADNQYYQEKSIQGGCGFGMIMDATTVKWYVYYEPDGGGQYVELATGPTDNTWHDVVMHWKISTGAGDDNGIVKIWVDNVLVYSKIDIDNDTKSSSLFKFGNNFATVTSADIYFDDIAVGTTGVELAGANVYAKTGVTTQPYVVLFDKNYGYIKSVTDSVNSEYDWHWNSNTLYVFSASDPDAAYTTPGIEASVRNKCLYVNGKSYLYFDSIVFQTADTVVLLEGDQSYNEWHNCTFENASTYGFVPSSGAGHDINNILIEDCTTRRNGGYGVIFTNQHDWTIRNLTSFRDGILSADYFGETWGGGIKSYYSTSYSNIIENCTVTYSGIRDDGYMPDSNNKGYGIWIDTVNETIGTETIVRYNNVNNCAISGLFCEKSDSIKWYYNISHDNGQYGFRMDTGDGSGDSSNYNTVYNNVFYGNDIGLWVVGAHNKTADEVTGNLFKNNISMGNTTTQFVAKWGAENDGTMGSGNVYLNNAFGIEYTNFIQWGEGGGATPDTYAEWYALYAAAEGNTIESDPLFTDAASNDFTLTAFSPAIDAGTPVGLTVDYLGLVVPAPVNRRLVDIGAYEYRISLGYEKKYKRFSDYLKYKRH